MLVDVTPGAVRESIRSPEDYAMTRCTPAALKGGDAALNATELAKVMNGEDT